jgi:hypothetical protein
MAQKETIRSEQIIEFLMDALLEQSPVIGSYLYNGKWHLLELRITQVSDECITFDAQRACDDLQPEQPVGICIHLGYFKYIFDTTVHTVGNGGLYGRIVLDMPGRVERIERRVYHRQPVPDTMKVKVMFWHRGYLDGDLNHCPEEIYWQGRLLNLSAGGSQFEIEADYLNHFKVGQLLDIQFTPMSYEKPLMLESHVKYLKELPDSNMLKIGVEFLGLEAGPEGREILDRILQVVDEYQKLTEQNQANNSEKIKS